MIAFVDCDGEVEHEESMLYYSDSLEIAVVLVDYSGFDLFLAFVQTFWTMMVRLYTDNYPLFDESD